MGIRPDLHQEWGRLVVPDGGAGFGRQKGGGLGAERDDGGESNHGCDLADSYQKQAPAPLLFVSLRPRRAVRLQ